MKRVTIIGSGGAGKSTLARRLGPVLGLPVIHLDREFWRPGWTETPKDEWRRRVEELVEEDEWIIDGNFGGTMDIRLAASDTVIFLDYPRFVCIGRALKRAMIYWRRTRPDMGEGCREKLDLEFLHWVWTFSGRARREIEERLARLDGSVQITRLRTPAETEAFLARIGTGRTE